MTFDTFPLCKDSKLGWEKCYFFPWSPLSKIRFSNFVFCLNPFLPCWENFLSFTMSLIMAASLRILNFWFSLEPCFHAQVFFHLAGFLPRNNVLLFWFSLLFWYFVSLLPHYVVAIYYCVIKWYKAVIVIIIGFL